MSRPSFAQLASRFIQQRAQAGFGKGPSSSGGGAGGSTGGPNLGQALGGVGGVVLLAAAGMTLNSALFNGEYSCLITEFILLSAGSFL